MTAPLGARLRSIPDDLAPEAVRAVDDRLAAIRREHNVSIGFAIESGSRAWGFPSPDSDYDCRFVFVRAADDYLSPWQLRDVIETPLEGLLDVNGWDLGKALKLLLKGNAVIVEWLMSPIVYQGDRDLVDDLRRFADGFAHRDGLANHYLHLGEKQRRAYFADGKDVQLKKLFYALRPAAALRWLRAHPERTVPPMHFPTLMRECDAPDDVRSLTEALIHRKARTRELGAAALPKPIEAFVDQEFALARQAFPSYPRHLTPEAKGEADRLFRSAVERFGAAASTFQRSDAR
ncbi:nucleotidyltransferase domain-containing protein [Sphingomonas parva]|uniref:Nucleotidyltransferase domain-containing protein n=1 Tax=Sphingomonas parva TaxID=2555898 RepID=A0A4Y8ZQS9_9SPHN|nr:nucleotidyltransferase domain-containing protein [Sphingomonas parva]TFI57179.1 nucleotidyltransferase domain-containing protein [Sphingomonas parva]